MLDERTNRRLVELYSIPHVDEVIFRDEDAPELKKKPVKCWICHHRPCICPQTK